MKLLIHNTTALLIFPVIAQHFRFTCLNLGALQPILQDVSLRILILGPGRGGRGVHGATQAN